MSIAENMGQMDTLSECHARAVKEGYVEEFKAVELLGKPSITYSNTKRGGFYSPEGITIKSFFRFEGQSDPGDSAILYLIETDSYTTEE